MPHPIPREQPFLSAIALLRPSVCEAVLCTFPHFSALFCTDSRKAEGHKWDYGTTDYGTTDLTDTERRLGERGRARFWGAAPGAPGRMVLGALP